MSSQASQAVKMSRKEFVTSLIGKPFRKNAKGPDAFDCWHLAIYVQYHLFGRVSPQIDVPEHASWGWMIEQFTTHRELENWVEVLQPANGLVTASDGAMVLMARNRQPAHCGVYLRPERKILHADEESESVVLQSVPMLKSLSWSRLRYYEPR